MRSKSYEFFNKWERDSERERGRDDLLNRYLLSKDLKDGRKSARGTHSFQRVKRFSSLREKERESRGRQAQSFSPSLLGTYLSSTYILSIFFLSLVHTFINFHSHTLLTLSLSPIPLLTDCTQPPCKALTHMFWEDMFSLFLSTYLSCSLDFYLSRGEISDISTRSVPYLPTYLPTYLLTYLPTYLPMHKFFPFPISLAASFFLTIWITLSHNPFSQSSIEIFSWMGGGTHFQKL